MSSSIDRELFSNDHNDGGTFCLHGDRSGGDDHMETMIHFFQESFQTFCTDRNEHLVVGIPRKCKL